MDKEEGISGRVFDTGITVACLEKDNNEEANWSKGLGELQKIIFERRIGLRIC